VQSANSSSCQLTFRMGAPGAGALRAMPIPPSELSSEQRVLYNDMTATIQSHLTGFQTAGKDGALVGPWSAWLQEPVIGGAIWNLTKVITTQATLPVTVRQTAILVVGAHFNAAYELYAHMSMASAGHVMSTTKITAIAAGQRPADLSSEEACAYDVANALTKGGVLPDSI